MTDGLKQLLENVLYVASTEKVEFIGFTLEKVNERLVSEVTWRNCLKERKDVVEFLRLIAATIEKHGDSIPAKELPRPS